MKRIVLVCTGNICRSPMAEAILRREFEARGLDPGGISSAGTGAWDGAPASEGAYLVALENQLDLTGHAASLLTSELVEEADLVLTMSRHHRSRAEELGGQGKTHVLGEFVGRPPTEAEVSDPFGGSLEIYRATYEEIDALVRMAADKLEEEMRDAGHG